MLSILLYFLSRNSFSCWGNLGGCVSYYKTSSFAYIEFITKEIFTRYTNITTKSNWKLFTKV